MNLLVDPIILTLPDDTADREMVEEFVIQLMRWSREARNKYHILFVSETCRCVLWNIGRYPLLKKFEAFWKRKNISNEIMDYQTAYSACMLILGNLPDFEERAGIQDVIDVDPEQVQVDPDLIERLPADVGKAFRETLGYVAFVRSSSESTITDLAVATHPIGDKALFRIDAEVETNNGQIQVWADCPLITTPDELLLSEEADNVCESIRSLSPLLKARFMLMAELSISFAVSELQGIPPAFYKVEYQQASISQFGKCMWLYIRKKVLSDELLPFPCLTYKSSFARDINRLVDVDTRARLQSRLAQISSILRADNGDTTRLKQHHGIQYDNYVDKKLDGLPIGHFRISLGIRVSCVAENGGLTLRHFGQESVVNNNP